MFKVLKSHFKQIESQLTLILINVKVQIQIYFTVISINKTNS